MNNLNPSNKNENTEIILFECLDCGIALKSTQIWNKFCPNCKTKYTLTFTIELWVDFQQTKSKITELKFTEIGNPHTRKLYCPECSGKNLHRVGGAGDFSNIPNLSSNFIVPKKRLGYFDYECNDCFSQFRGEIWMIIDFKKTIKIGI